MASEVAVSGRRGWGVSEVVMGSKCEVGSESAVSVCGSRGGRKGRGGVAAAIGSWAVEKKEKRKRKRRERAGLGLQVKKEKRRKKKKKREWACKLKEKKGKRKKRKWKWAWA